MTRAAVTAEQQAAFIRSLGSLQALQLALSALVVSAGFDDAAWQREGFTSRAHVEQLVRRLQSDFARHLLAALSPDPTPTDAPPAAPSQPILSEPPP